MAFEVPGHAYRVRLTDVGEIEWVNTSGEDAVVLGDEPLAGFWRRFAAAFYGILPIEGEL
jgi:hypothetical protein